MNEQADILFIDDQNVVIESARKVFETLELNFDWAHDANSALVKLWRTHYKVIFVDLMLPGTSGFEFIDMVHKKMPETILVMISGYATPRNVIKSFRMGVFDFLAKPFTFDELACMIQRVLAYLIIKQDPDQSHRQAQSPAKIIDCSLFGKHAWSQHQPDGSILIGLGESFLPCVGIQLKFQNIVGRKIHAGQVALVFSTIEYEYILWAPTSGIVTECNTALLDFNNLSRSEQKVSSWVLKLQQSKWNSIDEW